MIRRLGVALLVCVLAGTHDEAKADALLTFSPPATVIQVGASSTQVFANAPEGYGYLQVSSALPPQCPNVYLHIPFTGSTGSKAIYATAQMAFHTGARVSQVIWNVEQGTCVINHIFLVQ